MHKYTIIDTLTGERFEYEMPDITYSRKYLRESTIRQRMIIVAVRQVVKDWLASGDAYLNASGNIELHVEGLRPALANDIAERKDCIKYIID